MREMKSWAQYYVDGLTRLGVIRFGALLAVLIIVLAVLIQSGVTLLLRGTLDATDVVRSVFFGLLVTPWLAFFLTAVVDELEESRQRLTHLLGKQQEMRERDQALNQKLQSNIRQLNAQIAETQRADEARRGAMEELRAEVHRREEAQMELEDRSTLLRSLIDGSPDVIFYRNEQGQFLGCNAALGDMIGRSVEDTLGLNLSDVYPSEVAARIHASDQQVFATNSAVTDEEWMTYPDGRRAFYEMRKVPFFDARGKRLGLLGYGRDITERVQYQEQLEQASREKTTFISTISHELRTPLNGIVGLSRMLQETQLDAQQRKYLNTIHLSAVTLGNIFNDVIDVDKYERDRLQIALAPMDLPAFLGDLEALTRLMAEDKGLYLHFDLDGEMPHWVLADGTRLRQVLWNLTGNAIKFTQHGGVTLRVLLAPLPEDRLALRFEVEDTGVGIAQEELGKIFDMYYQVDGQQHAKGTGIGLAVSRMLVEAMGGQISVDSEEGHGSCFSVELEVACQNAPVEPQEGPLPALRILLVEDVELNITVATALLEKMGHQVTPARCGREALALTGTAEFDLMLLDIQLPDMTGFDVADRLHERYGADMLPPLVALTVNRIRDKSEYQAHGIVDVIGEPLAVDNIRRVLTSLFMAPARGSVPVNAAESDFTELDTGFLTDYTQLVGKAVLLEAVSLFAQTMPDYLAALQQALAAGEEAELASIAHKIKSATGAIGLARLHQLAKQAQSPELDDWQAHIADWVAELAEYYPQDLLRLQAWLAIN